MIFQKVLLAATMIGVNREEDFKRMIKVDVRFDIIECTCPDQQNQIAFVRNQVYNENPKLDPVVFALSRVAAQSAAGHITAWVGRCPRCKRVFYHE